MTTSEEGDKGEYKQWQVKLFLQKKRLLLNA